MKIAEVMQKFVKEGEHDRIVEPWTLVCWRGRDVICSGLRRVALERDDSAVTWVPEWWTDAVFTHQPDMIRKEVMDEVARCEE